MFPKLHRPRPLVRPGCEVPITCNRLFGPPPPCPIVLDARTYAALTIQKHHSELYNDSVPRVFRSMSGQWISEAEVDEARARYGQPAVVEYAFYAELKHPATQPDYQTYFDLALGRGIDRRRVYDIWCSVFITCR